MDLLMTYTDSIHITETDKGIEIVIDKPSEIYDWLQEIKAYYETDLFSVLYDLIRTERENERDEFWFIHLWKERDKRKNAHNGRDKRRWIKGKQSNRKGK